MENIKMHVENLIYFQIKNNIITKRDYIDVKNQLYYLLKLEHNHNIYNYENISYPSDSLEPILDYLQESNIIGKSLKDRDLFDAKIMNVFSSLSSTIEYKYSQIKDKNPVKALDFLYGYAKNLNYVRLNRTDKNTWFKKNTKYRNYN